MRDSSIFLSFTLSSCWAFILCTAAAAAAQIPIETPAPTPLEMEIPHKIQLLPPEIESVISDNIAHESSVPRPPNGFRIDAAAAQTGSTGNNGPSGLLNTWELQTERERELYAAQQIVMTMQEQQEALNRRLLAGDITNDFVKQYAAKSDNLTSNVVKVANQAMQPYLNGLQWSIGNFLVHSYLESVTRGAQLYYARAINQYGVDHASYAPVHSMTMSYTNFAMVSMRSQLGCDSLLHATQNILARL